VDILYLSGRKSAGVRGGLIATNEKAFYDRILEWLPVYEGFATYGGMSTKEVEAMAVGLREMTDPMVAGSGAEFVRYFVERLCEEGVPAASPRTSPRTSTSPGQSLRQYTSRRVCGAWNAARSRPTAIRSPGRK
jgi:tryptophanase